jgi:uncharacterized protein
MGVTDCHVHINPVWEMRPEARALIGNVAPDELRVAVQTDPAAFLAYLDRSGVDRAVLINYVSPEVVGYTEKANEFVADYVRADPDRLVAVGGLRATRADAGAEVERLVTRLGIRGIKLHPPHQGFAPNAYVDGTVPGLRDLYAACERLGVPVIFHTGTSVFPGARNRFGQPLLVEDVAVDFPELTIVLAHGGRPLWMDEAMFLVRRFPRVYLEVSSVPPARLLEYFPDLGRWADRVLFGSDWPGPGVRDIGANLAAFRALPLAAEVQRAILEENPERVFPRRAVK